MMFWPGEPKGETSRRQVQREKKKTFTASHGRLREEKITKKNPQVARTKEGRRRDTKRMWGGVANSKVRRRESTS